MPDDLYCVYQRASRDSRWTLAGKTMSSGLGMGLRERYRERRPDLEWIVVHVAEPPLPETLPSNFTAVIDTLFELGKELNQALANISQAPGIEQVVDEQTLAGARALSQRFVEETTHRGITGR